MAAPAAALLAIMNLHQNNQRQAHSTRAAAANSVQAAHGASDKRAATAQKYLTDCRSFYSCLYCRAHLANHDELVSRSFQGNRSRAYLFNSVINITTGAPVQRELNTGSHAVADIFCSNCATTVGWKYERAYVDSQKYKEGKFIIELAHVVRENRHLELDKRDMFLALHLAPQTAAPTLARFHAHGSGPALGQSRQGSLSPLSNSADSRWSSGISSGSSQGAAEPLSRHSEPVGLYEFDEHPFGPDDDDDEHEVLMFPFHDDLYGERASYSNLSISRLSYRSRNRRSLHLNSTPYDWKYSTRPSASLSLEPGCSPEQPAAASSSSLPAAAGSRRQTAEPAPKPGDTSNGTRHEQSPVSRELHSDESSSDEDDGENQRRDHDENEIQFKLEPCETGPSAADTQNCDRLRANKRTRLGPGSRSSWDCKPAVSGTSSESCESQPDAPACVSVDEEEFYDCCTGEHQVANS